MEKRLRKVIQYLIIQGDAMSQEDVANKVNVSSVYLSKLVNGAKSISTKFIFGFCQVFPQISLEYILNGIEPMLKNEYEPAQNHTISKIISGAVPVIPFNQVEKYINGGITDLEPGPVIYYMPGLVQLGADFMCKVIGSELPYFSGVHTVCLKKVEKIIFFQWGRVYLLVTSQGVIFKRVYQGKTDNEIICSSDNEEKLPSFVLPISDITALALVVTVIRFD